MPTALQTVRPLIFALSMSVLGCHAQAPAAPAKGAVGSLSPELARRVEILIRSKSNVPPNYDIRVGPREKSDVPGFDKVTVNFSAEGKTSSPLTFLLSTDGKTLGQFTRYDISKDPKLLVSAADRPARGGPADAPVVIVGYDDLECPFCAKMHAQLFPALLERYKNQVRIVYRDFPLDMHPWAMRAAIDANCVGTLNGTAYWNMVDYVHLHAADLGGTEKSLAKANDALDSITRDEAKKNNLNSDAVSSCIARQDQTAVQASIRQASALGIDSTPVLFINGEKLEGAVPLEFVYRMIDNALIAAGQTPPPPVTHPAPQAPPAIKPGT